MARRIQNKHQAKKATMLAQIVAMIFVVAAGAAGFKGLPWLAVSPPDKPSIHPQQPAHPKTDTKTDTSTQPAVDAMTITENLMALGNAPVPDAKPVEPSASNDDTTADNQDTQVLFIGSIISRKHPAAFLKIDGTTKMLKPGQQYGSVKLISVDTDSVVITIDDGDEQTLDQAPREGSAVTVVPSAGSTASNTKTNNTTSGKAFAPNDITNRFRPDMTPEERRQMLMEEARKSREKINRERNRLSPNRSGPGRNNR